MIHSRIKAIQLTQWKLYSYKIGWNFENVMSN